MVYLTSDLHLGHNAPFIYKARGFNSMEEHDRTIIQNINDTVGREDVLWILGDLCMGYPSDLLKEINCRSVYVISGNHETPIKTEFYKNECGFNIYGSSYQLTYETQRYFLCHYPVFTLNRRYKENLSKEVICLYGHTHQKDSFFRGIAGEEIPIAFHVGLDSNDNKPISIVKARELIVPAYIEAVRREKDFYDIDIDR